MSGEWLAHLGDHLGYDVLHDALETFRILGVERNGEACGLDRTESLAVYFYTCGFANDASLFKIVNEFLRSGRSIVPGIVISLSRDLASAVGKLPIFGGFVYRRTTLPRTVKARLIPGMEFSDRAFLSASSAPNLLFSGADILVARSISGRNLAGLTAFPTENEVLFMPGTQFTIGSIETVGGGILVQMAELV